jgi:ABC-type transport system substrate-binding protein
MRFPSKRQWLQLFKILDKKERMLFLTFLLLFLISSFSLLAAFYVKKSEIRPAVGGTFTEGVVGAPRFINPLYAGSNDVDHDLTELIFSGLMKYDQRGEIVCDLAKIVDVKEKGRSYEVYLKEDVFWHDGERLTADDVIFTLETMQNPDYKSSLRGDYMGIEAEKINDHLIRFELKEPYAGLEERLTFKILPEHIWQDVSPQNFLLKKYNWQPVGSGPYCFKDLSQNKEGAIISLQLTRFNKYFATGPYISQINFRFFSSEENLIKEIVGGRIDGFSLLEGPAPAAGFKEYSFSLPRYFAVFLNIGQSNFLAEKEIRQALNYGTNKELLVEKFLSNKGEIIDYYPFDLEKAEELLKAAGLEKREGKLVEITKGKIVEFRSDLKEGSRGTEVTVLQRCLATDSEVYPEGRITGYFGSQTKAAVIAFQEKYAEEILTPSDLKSGTGTVGPSTRAKLNKICSKSPTETEVSFTLLTVEDPILEKVAEEIAQQWKKLGIALRIETHPFSQLKKDFIKPREYEMLLCGQILSIVRDPFPFWHSSQIKDPGLNLSKYQNEKTDRLLEDARTILDSEEREARLQEFQNILIEDAPAVFLYNPDCLYWVSERVKGVKKASLIANPSKRFSNINEWYIKTKRR